MIEELARRATAAGLAVRYRPPADLDTLGPAADVAYRIVQESLTNHLKHAPGAPVKIAVQQTNGHLDVEVISAAPQHAPSGLEHTGGGRGLDGMRRRVADGGGTLTAGPTPTGGWRVAARLPSPAHRTTRTGHLWVSATNNLPRGSSRRAFCRRSTQRSHGGDGEPLPAPRVRAAGDRELRRIGAEDRKSHCTSRNKLKRDACIAGMAARS